ncbi:MAG: formate/nitrite transporter family protein [Planctomycetes bacterium]|nr:formate/nitrite transporter family protein [Planctomycetota bacterium]
MPEKGFLTPAELANEFVGVGVKKAQMPLSKLLLLGILAGVYIGFASHLATVVGTEWGPTLFGLKQVMLGAVFSVGLMLVIIPGSELFTGNNLMTVALCHGKLGFGGILRNWVPVYFANLIGSIILAWIIASASGLLDGPIGATAIQIAHAKVLAEEGHNYAFFFRGICCNFLVCIAVMMAIAAKDITGKILGIFFPIMAFVASGFEHCVANMYFIPAGIFAKNFPDAVVRTGYDAVELSALTWSTMWSNNLLSVTLGNIVGGAIFVGVVYYFLYVRGAEEADN